MKKGTIILILLTISMTLFAQNMVFSGGVKGGLGFYNLNGKDSGSEIGNNMIDLNLGVFADATYFRLTVDYEMFLSGKHYEVGFGEVKLIATEMRYINISVLGKYPINLGIVKLWPAVGGRYSVPLRYVLENADWLSLPGAKLDDFYIIGGAGADMDFGAIYLSIQVLYCYNITPEIGFSGPPPTIKFNGSNIECTVGVGFIF